MKKSFTLIELLIVIVVIGVIMTLAMPGYKKIMIRTRGAEAKQNVRMLVESVWRYYVESGEFPPGDITGTLPIDLLDVDLPDSSSQAFRYFYYNIYASVGEYSDSVWIIAYDEELLTKGVGAFPQGAILGYGAYYNYDEPTTYMGTPAQRMDEHYYVHYRHSVKAGTGYQEVIGWP